MERAKLQHTLTYLIRVGITGEVDDPITLSDSEWEEIITLAAGLNVMPQVCDAIERLGIKLSKPLVHQVIGYTVQMENGYQVREQVLLKLANFFSHNGIKTMVLKGWALAQLYPKPSHRNFSDVDIYLYGEQPKADHLVEEKFGVKIDKDHHCHTVYLIAGVSVENHYDFVNNESHRSAEILNRELKRLALEESEQKDGVCLPPPTCHALFLLAHTAYEYAGTNISLRQLIDWWLFTQRYSSSVDWKEVERVAAVVGLERFLPCLNDASKELMEGGVEMSELSRRVYDDIWFGPDRELGMAAHDATNYMAKFRRWWLNRWKHKLVYNESLISQFFTQARSHFVKPEVD